MSVLCFWRKFVATRAAIFASPFGLATAVFANGWKTSGDTWDLSAVNAFVAKTTKGDSVVHVIAQLWMIFPLLHMVSLYPIFFAAMLASVVVTSINGIAPLPIFVTIAFFVTIRFARCKGFAFTTTILGFELSVCRGKLLKAIGTRQFFPSAALCRQLTGTRPRASGDYFAGAKMADKLSAADNTLRAMAGVAIPLPGVISLKLASAQIAQNRPNGDGGSCAFAVCVLYAKFCFTFDFLCTPWKRALFACCHDVILPHCDKFRNLQRWADMTGKTPIRLT